MSLYSHSWGGDLRVNVFSGGYRIFQIGRQRANLGYLLFGIIFAENGMKMEVNGPRIGPLPLGSAIGLLAPW